MVEPERLHLNHDFAQLCLGIRTLLNRKNLGSTVSLNNDCAHSLARLNSHSRLTLGERKDTHHPGPAKRQALQRLRKRARDRRSQFTVSLNPSPEPVGPEFAERDELAIRIR